VCGLYLFCFSNDLIVVVVAVLFTGLYREIDNYYLGPTRKQAACRNLMPPPPFKYKGAGEKKSVCVCVCARAHACELIMSYVPLADFCLNDDVDHGSCGTRDGLPNWPTGPRGP